MDGERSRAAFARGEPCRVARRVPPGRLNGVCGCVDPSPVASVLQPAWRLVYIPLADSSPLADISRHELRPAQNAHSPRDRPRRRHRDDRLPRSTAGGNGGRCRCRECAHGRGATCRSPRPTGRASCRPGHLSPTLWRVRPPCRPDALCRGAGDDDRDHRALGGRMGGTGSRPRLRPHVRDLRRRFGAVGLSSSLSVRRADVHAVKRRRPRERSRRTGWTAA